MVEFIANTVPPDPMISGNWIMNLSVAVITAAGIAWARVSGFKKGEQSKRVTLEDPLPTMPVRKVYESPSWDAHHALKERVAVVESKLETMRHELAMQYRELMTAGSNRGDTIAEKIDGVARGIHKRIDELFKSKN